MGKLGQPSLRNESVPVPVVDVGIMRVHMKQGLVPVRVAVRFSSRIVRGVPMLVMFIVGVDMVVLHWLVLMLVFVALGQV